MLIGFLNNKIVKNASWIIVSKVIQSILGLFVAMITARYLGPSNYGLINYAMSLVGFVTPLVFLGINNTLVHELTKNHDEGQIIGTSICLSFISALCCIVSIFLFVLYLDAGELDTIIVCMLYSMILIFQVLDLVQYWFQYKLLSKYSSIVMLVSYFIVSLYKILILIMNKNVYWFAVANTIDYFIISLSLLYLYRKMGGKKLVFSKSMAINLLSSSKYYIIPGLMVSIFAQTDKLMLKLMINVTETGYYSAAVSCATMTAFVYAAIIDSFRPIIFKSYEVSIKIFELNLKRLYLIITYISVAQAVIMSIFSEPIIRLLYGDSFIPASKALMIVCWYVTFSYYGSIRNIWMLCKKLQRYLWIINIFGAVLNIALNSILIPLYGIVGAATASLMTQFFANFVIGFFIKPLKKNNELIIYALNPNNIKYLI